MALTEKQRSRLLEALKQKWPVTVSACVICRANNWQVSDSVFELREYQSNVFGVGSGAIYPVIPVMCGTCGHVIFFNAIKLGVIEMPSPRQEHGE
jgi:hypothetical protein